MIKYADKCALLLMLVFCTSCGQNQTNVPKDNIYSQPKNIISSYGPNLMVRNIKQDRNGNILIAGSNTSVFGDVFRYDGKSFTNPQVNWVRTDFGMFWKIDEEIFGSVAFYSII